MTPAQRTAAIRKAALKALADQASLMTPKGLVVDFMQASVLGAVPTILECEQALRWLESAGMLVAVNPQMGGDPTYRITDLGRTEA